ncbi:GntR family transcriptional regulator [Sphingomonas sanguinis]|uniref:GntR family transcriptional regulator n=2 Tax=Sphingomonas sanguinis TaxID=33051 RepID=A0A147HTC3_9SPHN|nr:GntR family transcriptional regulator [Sphingomonas sanguinis]
MGGITFLNEVMSHYPSAISFAPGAPNVTLLENLDIGASVARFLDFKKANSSVPGAAERLLREYGPSRGIINDLIAKALSIDGVVAADPREVIVTAGAQEAMLLALRALFGDPRHVLVVSDPCYVGIVGAARLLGIDVVPVNEGAGGLDLDQLRGTIAAIGRAGKSVRAVYVAPDFANPSGALMSLSCRHEILDLADRHDFYLLEDSAYAFTQEEEAEIPTLKTLDESKRVVFIGTFAKIAVPGIRVGYAVADQSVIGTDGDCFPLASAMATLKSMTTVNTSPICQAIVGGLLLGSDGSMRCLGREKGAFYRANLAYLLDRLEHHCGGTSSSTRSISWNSPAGGFFVRVKLPVPVDLLLLKRSAIEFDVVWTPMRQFFLTSAGDYEMRLSCSYLDRPSIENGVARLARFFSTLP